MMSNNLFPSQEQQNYLWYMTRNNGKKNIINDTNLLNAVYFFHALFQYKNFTLTYIYLFDVRLET